MSDLLIEEIDEMIKTAKKEAVYVEDWEIYEAYINLIDSGIEHEQALVDALDFALDLNAERTQEIMKLAAECMELMIELQRRVK